jgi:hypothetical protein
VVGGADDDLGNRTSPYDVAHRDLLKNSARHMHR